GLLGKEPPRERLPPVGNRLGRLHLAGRWSWVRRSPVGGAPAPMGRGSLRCSRRGRARGGRRRRAVDRGKDVQAVAIVLVIPERLARRVLEGRAHLPGRPAGRRGGPVVADVVGPTYRRFLDVDVPDGVGGVEIGRTGGIEPAGAVRDDG